MEQRTESFDIKLFNVLLNWKLIREEGQKKRGPMDQIEFNIYLLLVINNNKKKKNENVSLTHECRLSHTHKAYVGRLVVFMWSILDLHFAINSGPL